jgi:hypothetical protein
LELNLERLQGVRMFGSYFHKETVEQIARETGFISRKSSRLTGEAFLKMMVYPIIGGDTEWSLNDQCDYLQEHFGIEMTKQSLDERYHTFTVAFMKTCKHKQPPPCMEQNSAERIIMRI